MLEEVRNTLLFKLAEDIFPIEKYKKYNFISLYYVPENNRIRVRIWEIYPRFIKSKGEFEGKKFIDLPDDEFKIGLLTSWNSEYAEKAIIARSEWEFYKFGTVDGIKIDAKLLKQNNL